ncbi:hypothetical protein DFH06DRAFT_1340734 [Mycena polygramma]|nr:hypothetical protein DFH06DRAFT_1340734 [Mycena polygramma]
MYTVRATVLEPAGLEPVRYTGTSPHPVRADRRLARHLSTTLLPYKTLPAHHLPLLPTWSGCRPTRSTARKTPRQSLSIPSRCMRMGFPPPTRVPHRLCAQCGLTAARSRVKGIIAAVHDTIDVPARAPQPTRGRRTSPPAPFFPCTRSMLSSSHARASAAAPPASPNPTHGPAQCISCNTAHPVPPPHHPRDLSLIVSTRMLPRTVSSHRLPGTANANSRLKPLRARRLQPPRLLRNEPIDIRRRHHAFHLRISTRTAS